MNTTITVAATWAALFVGQVTSALGTTTSGIAPARGPQPQNALTFAKDVAPIIFAHCSRCHQPGGVAPFSLLSSDDLRFRRRQLATAVRTRLMPPWKAEPGHGQFAGERRLSDEQIDVILRWLEQGAAEGDPSELPPLPPPPDRWQLGQPDLVITMSAPFTLPADGREVFRNFVLPVSIPETRYVKAWEFRPGNAKVTHHATLHLDPTRSSRRLDEQDPASGYEGLVPFSVKDPAGYFLGWTPGQQPYVAATENAWVLEKDSDLILMMHLRPTGKEETIQASVGLYFSQTPPSRVPLTLRLGSQAIDIPANARQYMIRDSYTLPVDVNIFTVYPHAHYLAREIRAAATFPDGSTQRLLYIKDWDFNWQDVYRYREPVFLPAGTTILVEYTYDNSADNPRNPHRPPRRVTFGKNASDEMGDLWVQVVPRNPADLPALTRDFVRKSRPETIRGLEMILRAEPDNPALHDNAALLYEEEGDLQKALQHFVQSLRIRPDSAVAHYNIGTTLLKQGNRRDAAESFRQALTLDPGYHAARHNLGVALQQDGRLEEAAYHYRESIRAQPGDAAAHYNLGAVLHQQGNVIDAIGHLREALRLRPRYPVASHLLGIALRAQGELRQAVQEYRAAIEASPDWAVPMISLAWLLATSPDTQIRRPGEALMLARRAGRILGEPSPAVFDTVGASLAALGDFEQAAAAAEAALASAGRLNDDDMVVQIRQRLALYRSGKPYVEPR